MAHPVFIVSTGRTGTKALAHFLGQLVQRPVISLHEPPPDLFHLSVHYARGLNLRQAMKQFQNSRPEATTAVEKGTTYIEANPNGTWLVPVIRAAWPDVHVILVVRDPRTWIRSELSNRGNPGRSGMRITAETLPADAFASKWPDMTPIQRAAWNWLRMNERALAGTVDNVWKYEWLFTNPAAIPRLIDEAGLQMKPDQDVAELLDQKINATRDYALTPWESWKRATRRDVLRICGDLMATFGYGDA